jgi:hypothetical protein
MINLRHELLIIKNQKVFLRVFFKVDLEAISSRNHEYSPTRQYTRHHSECWLQDMADGMLADQFVGVFRGYEHPVHLYWRRLQALGRVRGVF